MRLIVRFLCFFPVFAFLISCGNSAGDPSIVSFAYSSYKDIPGVTSQEIASIQAFQDRGISFVFGMIPTTEAFKANDNTIQGFSAFFCDWLSDLFGIPFNLSLYEWNDLVIGLENGRIDFTGCLSPTEDRRESFYMTSPIIQRTLKYFHIKGNPPLDEIAQTRPLRFVFLEGTTTSGQLLSSDTFPEFEAIYVNNFDAAYVELKEGRSDAFFSENSSEYFFDFFDDIAANDFYPMVFSSVSMAASRTNNELESVISIVQKALQNGGRRYLTSLHNRGYKEYLRHKLFLQLTNDEKIFLQTRPAVAFAAEYDNYPLCFYNAQEKQWQGIAFDVMNEIELLTGLSFNLINENRQIEWPDMINMLENGTISMVTELIQNKERELIFLWPQNPIIVDNYALLSKSEFPNISFSEILSVKVGLPKGTAYTALFNSWFPDHEFTVEYETSGEAFTALDRGEVDMVMSSQYRFLLLTNYRGLPAYKANVVFDRTFNSSFGFNRNEVVLCSIVDKSLDLIDVDAISGQWMRRTFDYRVRLMEARMPIAIGAPVIGIIIIFLFILLYRIFNERKRLEIQVRERTLELNKSQTELTEALEAAKTANASKSIFLANMSHEIRTPMNSIMGFSELAMDGETSEKTKDYLAKIQTNIEWLLQIINDILDISKIESGKMELENIPFDIHELFNSCRALVMPKAVEKGIMLHFYAEPSVGMRPLGDPTRLRQVFVNLLSNAIKFTHAGMVKLLSEIISTSDNSVTIHFEIKDSGIGMTSEQIEKIFEPFTQGESGTMRKYGGTGLGLAITKNIVEMMGGKLSVESTLGIGSKFNFDLIFKTIPVTEEEKYEKKLLLNEIEKPAFDGEILVCEDNNMNQFVIKEHLARIGINTVIAENGKIGVEKVRERIQTGERMFDIIFMDMHMPVMDGFEASAEILNLNVDVPMVAMTANIMAEDLEIYKASGMPDCLSKPFTSQELWRCLLKYLKPL
ncbi:MAG: transporter substrate-binding domain-containing protein [Treponema sp.]|nr:transporter substrate-binding domain-containing protein [Treponema sp.]